MNDIHTKISYGKVNVPGATLSVAAFELKAPFVRVLATQAGRRSGRPHHAEVSPFHSEFGGFSTDPNVAFDEGTILMFLMRATRNGISIADGAVFIRLRQNAAVLNIKAILPAHKFNLLGVRHIVYTGKGDILDVDEVRAFGIQVPDFFAENNTDIEQINELFDIDELSPETAPAPVLKELVTSQGVVLREVAEEPIRRIRLRR